MKAYCKYCESETIAFVNLYTLQLGCDICKTGIVLLLPDALEPTKEAVDTYHSSLSKKLIKKAGV